jgi:2,3-bisphosphoglycerate-independent phosphoglycerate mutase
MSKKKAALIILDGWGIGDGSKADAITSANTPVFDRLMREYPHGTLKTFGENVGLPHGQMGNSEVGHLNIGAGRIVYQDLLKINRSVESGEFSEMQALKDAIEHAEKNNVSIHLMGLVSGGGVHSNQDHLLALVRILERSSLTNVFVHAFTDGRDTAPRSAFDAISELEKELEGKKSKLVSMIGRYYAMDRDKRWERIKLAYDLLMEGKGEPTTNFAEHCKSFYQEDLTDEFFRATVIASGEGRIKKDDVVICFNFRTDRCRQITTALTQQDFPEFGMNTIPLYYVTMTRYDETFQNVHVIFEKDNLVNTLGEVVSKAGLKQLRIAETEKYPHVTFFFSGGREVAFSGEQRIVVASPKVATYDLQPEMSASEVTQRVIETMNSEQPDFICLNFANPDMVGHTGVYPAIIKAVETIDAFLGEVFSAGKAQGYSFIIIADHGNADIAFLPNGTPHTAHTTNLVPCIVASEDVATVTDGILADVAPSILKLIGVEAPNEMTGSPLF